MKIERAAVTGATGFIGRHLVDRLHREAREVRIFDRRRHSFEDKASLETLVAGCNVIFHLAAKNTPSDSELFKVNVLGTANLLQAAKVAAPGSRIVFSSTFAVYKLPERGERISEDFTIAPRNEFGLSKLLAEELLRFYAKPGTLKASVLRISNAYGPQDRPGRSVVANFMDAAENGGSLTIYGDGSQTRDFIYVDDVVDALVKAAQTPGDFIIINVCSGEEISINQLLGLVKEVSGNDIRVSYKDPNLSGGGFWRGENSLARSSLSWNPRVSLADGLLDTWQSLNEDRNSNS